MDAELHAHFVMFAGKDEKQESVLAGNRSTPYIEVLQLSHYANRLPLTKHFLPFLYNDTYSLSSQTTWVHPEMLRHVGIEVRVESGTS